jgi:lysophospholipase L1-like esterase
VETYLKKIYALAQQKKSRVLVCTLLPCNHATPGINKQILEVNDWIRSFARKNHFLLCDTYPLMQDPKSPGRLLHTKDGLHPDVEGYRKMGEAIAETLEAPRKGA